MNNNTGSSGNMNNNTGSSGNMNNNTGSSNSRDKLEMEKQDQIRSMKEVANKDCMSSLPLELLYKVLLLLDVRTLFMCRFISHHYADIIADVPFWQKAAKTELKLSQAQCRYLFGRMELFDWKWQLYALMCELKPFDRNLLENGSAQMLTGHPDEPHGLSGRSKLQSIPHWTILENGGDGWQVERPPFGAKPVPNATNQEDSVHQEDPADGGNNSLNEPEEKEADYEKYLKLHGTKDIVGDGCFVTSYQSCIKRQLIDLTKVLGSKGMMIMYCIIPYISVSEWVAGRHDCECRSALTVNLLDKFKKKICTWRGRTKLGQGHTGSAWTQVATLMQKHRLGPIPVEYVEVVHGGRDSCFWSGWYGPKITGTAVKLVIPSTNYGEITF